MTDTICILVPGLSGGGAEFVAGQWATGLAESGRDVLVVATHESAVPARDLPFEVRTMASTTFPARVRELAGILSATRPAVIVSLMPHWNVLSLLATSVMSGARPRTIISGRNIESGLSARMGRSYRAELFLAHRLYRRADAYVAISHPVAAEAIASYGLKPERVWVVPNPAAGKVDLDAARQARQERLNRRDNRGPLRLVIPGRLVPQKQPEIPVLVASRLRELGVAVDGIDYFGSGPLQSKVEHLAREAGIDVKMHGWVDRWFDHAGPGSVLLLPSYAEGFGNVFVEAGAYGVPSAATSRALGVADAIAPGLTGHLAPSDSIGDLAEAVAKAAEITVPVELDGWLRNFSRSSSLEILERAMFTSR
ncbi:glycosyltransferase [Microbacterium sp. RURRCA19A]|uniref:glycosyltransferase n=1 Tax=Microbacterium sp. RURRCA19A TaxID=1907391 RepID=UPI000956CC0E|nr:glycosyltransferase [Microbacterium sp. RURRCA19A]SIR78518.1 Glycosyltransferase involved in cell wall bisynthesis [Microbacterium sp. RURRCA19A]